MNAAAQHNEIKAHIMGLDIAAIRDVDAFWASLFREFPDASEAAIARALKDAADSKREEGRFHIGLADAADLVANYLETIPEGVDRGTYIREKVAAGDPQAIAVANAMFLIEGNMEGGQDD